MQNSGQCPIFDFFGETRLLKNMIWMSDGRGLGREDICGADSLGGGPVSLDLV